MSLLYRYIEYKKNSEVPPIYHRWSLISAVATMLERKVHFMFTKPMYPNMYVLLVGVPAARKSEAVTGVTRLMRGAGYERFAANKASKQQFIKDMENSQDSLDSGWDAVDACYIGTDEFLDFIGRGNLEFITLLTHLWDNPPEYKESYRKEKMLVINPTVNMLSAATPVNIQLGLPLESGGTGFLSRTIMVYSEPTGKRITWPDCPNEEIEAEFSQALIEIGSMTGAMEMTQPAKDLIDHIYQEYTYLDDSRLLYYNGRRLIHLFKLCMVIAAMNGSMTITQEHVLEANTILVHTEENMHKAFGEFGKSKYTEVYGKVISYMENTRKPVTTEDLFKVVAVDIDGMHDLIKVMENLVNAGRIINSGTAFILRRTNCAERRKYTDFARYIQEAEIYERNKREHSELERKLLELARQREANLQ